MQCEPGRCHFPKHLLARYSRSPPADTPCWRGGVQGGLQGMLRVLEGQFLRDILAPAGVIYDDVLKKSRWAALDNRSFRSRKRSKPPGPGSFR